MKKYKRSIEELLEELDNRYGNPNGPVESKMIVEAIHRFRELNDELIQLKVGKS